MIWERTRQGQRLRHQLREYYCGALEAFDDLHAPDALELLGKAPDPARGARLTRAQVSAARKRAGRRNITDKATAILAALRGEQMGQPAGGHRRLRGIEHNDALRRLASRLVGILHGCLKTRTLYDEATAWEHRQNLPQTSVAA
jgi:hypothetical protein